MERSAYEDCTGITQPRDGKIPCAPRFAGAASSNHHERVDVYVLFHCMQIVQRCSSFRCNSSNMMQHHPLRRLRTFATPSSQHALGWTRVAAVLRQRIVGIVR